MSLPDAPAFVSTGALPDRDRVRALVSEAHERHRINRDGEPSRIYPGLAAMDPDLFGVCVVGTNGASFAAGDADDEFTIMSVSKPFVFALVCERLGVAEARRRLGVNATGRPFNSLAAIEGGDDGRTNPMVNPGAIAASSCAGGASTDDRWQFIHDGLSRFAGRELAIAHDVYESALATNARNHAIARRLRTFDRLYCEPAEAVDLYTRQCSLLVTARDLAVMGATLADGGVNPVTGQPVVDAGICHHTLAVMLTAGLYESSGDWLYEVGLPGKSGIGGGIVTVSPGKGGLGTFAPRLDAMGTSIKGALAARDLSAGLGLDLLTSRPAGV